MKPKIDDPFLRHFFDRIPADIAATFTDDQLDAVKLAFGIHTLADKHIEQMLK